MRDYLTAPREKKNNSAVHSRPLLCSWCIHFHLYRPPQFPTNFWHFSLTVGIHRQTLCMSLYPDGICPFYPRLDATNARKMEQVDLPVLDMCVWCTRIRAWSTTVSRSLFRKYYVVYVSTEISKHSTVGLRVFSFSSRFRLDFALLGSLICNNLMDGAQCEYSTWEAIIKGPLHTTPTHWFVGERAHLDPATQYSISKGNIRTDHPP